MDAFRPGPNHDYSETRACLVRAIAALDAARVSVGRTNLPPTAAPHGVRRQIDDVAAIVAEVSSELEAARLAATAAGRRGLTLVSPAG